MYRQKGTGHARAGHKRSGVRRGGGHIFAKRPRDFTYRLNRKALQIATRMAIASKIQSGSCVVIDELSMAAPKTREIAGLLDRLNLSGASALIATQEYDGNVYKSSRNIKGVAVSPVAELNALSVLQPKRILLTRAAIDQIKETMAT